MKGSLSINTNFLPYAGPSEQGLQGLPNQNFVNNTSKTFYLKKALGWYLHPPPDFQAFLRPCFAAAAQTTSLCNSREVRAANQEF